MACGVSRQTLINYSKDPRDRRYFDAINMARQRVEEALELGLYTQKQVAGFIFSLKNNFGWKDTQEVEHTHTVVLFNPEPPVIDVFPKENADRPALGTGDVVDVTFASTASLSPVTRNS